MVKVEKKIIAKKLRGVVLTVNGSKTVGVRVETKQAHPLYGKIVKSHRKYLAHDEKNESKVGDTVIIEDSRPLSARKTWVVKSILNKD